MAPSGSTNRISNHLLANEAAIAQLECRRLDLIRQAGAAQTWMGQGARSLAEWVAQLLGVSRWKAHRWIGAAHALPQLPKTELAFLEGRLSLDKVLELCRFATPEHEAKLVAWAERVTPASVRRKADLETRQSLEATLEAHRSRYLTYWWFDEGRRLGLEGSFPADQGAVIAKALDRMADRLPDVIEDDEAEPERIPHDETIEERRADALYGWASARIADDQDADRATVVVHAPLEAMNGTLETGCGMEDGPALHAETARRLACDGLLEVVLHNERGEVVGIGRKERKVPRWLLRQLKHRDGRCTFPNCESKAFLHAHHIHFWGRGGRTDLGNLTLVCTFHHKLVHEFGWTVELDQTTGSTRWFRPGGREFRPARPPPKLALAG